MNEYIYNLHNIFHWLCLPQLSSDTCIHPFQNFWAKKKSNSAFTDSSSSEYFCSLYCIQIGWMSTKSKKVLQNNWRFTSGCPVGISSSSEWYPLRLRRALFSSLDIFFLLAIILEVFEIYAGSNCFKKFEIIWIKN